MEQIIAEAIKQAMRDKDKTALEALRAVKSAILLAKTDGRQDDNISDEEVVKIIQKLVKQRKEAADIYQKQNRSDLAEVELNQSSVLEKFLPKQLSEKELQDEISKIISQMGSVSAADMGRIIGQANKALAGRAEGKAIADAVKKALS